MQTYTLTDMHIHGGYGIDLMTADSGDIIRLSQKLKDGNVGMWTPTLIGDTLPVLCERVKAIADAAKDCPEIVGIHIEGPFISSKKSGVLPKENIIPCDIKYFDTLAKYGLPLRFTVAPECPKAVDFIKYVTESGGTVTLGHSDDDGTMTRKAIAAGAAGFTHLFNAMRSIHHRNGSIAQTALLSGLPCEIIADKRHLSPDTVKMIYKTIGLENIVLVTDAMSAMQSSIGEYDFCNKKVYFDGKTVSVGGTLAGSCLTMQKALDNFCEITGEDKKTAAEASLKNSLKLIRSKHK
ncbi:MAG: hypothetical protein IJR59_06205 [Firmicutes bacterium]|nr:hypothetical protein [Bacillota bacterium]